MKKHNVISFSALSLSIALSLALALSLPAWAGKQVVGPYEVIIYQHPGFLGPSNSYKVEPWMRQKLVPQIKFKVGERAWQSGKRIGSIRVGSKVDAWVFPHEGFYSNKKVPQCWKWSHWRDISIFRSKISFKCDVKSLIVSPKYHADFIRGYSGIFLYRTGSAGGTKHPYTRRFFPLPESLNKREVCYPNVGYKYTGYTTATLFGPRTASGVLRGWVQADLYKTSDCKGVPLTLPGAVVGKKSIFGLEDYGYAGKVASLKVRWTGPEWKPPPPGPPVVVRAPEAPIPKWEEPGTDRPGSNYKHFLASRGLGQCQEACKKDPRCKAYTYIKPTIKHKYAGYCWLKTRAPRPVARDCCVSGVKTSVAERPPPSTVLPGKLEVMPKPGAVPPKPGVAPKPTIPDLAGNWLSNTGVLYQITQSGNQFSWTVAALQEKGKGTMSGGKYVSASWSGSLGSGSAKGHITKVDSKGRATRIEWNNGVIFTRQK